MYRRQTIEGRSGLSEELGRDARETAEFLIIEQLLDDQAHKHFEPGPPTDIGESFGDNREPKSIFICGRCDMIVHEDDPACEFCGAEFEDAGSERGERGECRSLDRQSAYGDDHPQVSPLSRPMPLLRMSSAEKVDVLSIFESNRSKLGDEHIAGGASNNFLSYAKMLRSIENTITEAGEFGVETGEARKTLLAAWKACHEGKWDRAMQLAEESKRILAPGVKNLVESQLFCLRSALVEMKRKGRSVTTLIIEMKGIHKELSEMRLDEAMRSTKAIISEIKKIQMHILDNIIPEKVIEEDRTAYRGQGI